MGTMLRWGFVSLFAAAGPSCAGNTTLPAGNNNPPAHMNDDEAPLPPGTGMGPKMMGGGGPTDPFGIAKIYATAAGGEEWYMNMDDATRDSRFDPKATITKNADGSWKMKQTQVRMNVFTSTGYDQTAIKSYNPTQLTTQGYMQAANDWKNIEITGYVKVNSTGGDDNFAWYGRGGHHTDSQPCEGTCYKGDLFFSGKIRLAKESWHVSYDYTNYGNTVSPSPKTQWTGFKTVIYNMDQGGKTAVKIELYTNTNQDKTTWTKSYEWTDDGTWAGDMAHCGGMAKVPVVWGGPIVTFRWDTATDVDFKWLSVREVAPGQMQTP